MLIDVVKHQMQMCCSAVQQSITVPAVKITRCVLPLKYTSVSDHISCCMASNTAKGAIVLIVSEARQFTNESSVCLNNIYVAAVFIAAAIKTNGQNFDSICLRAKLHFYTYFIKIIIFWAQKLFICADCTVSEKKKKMVYITAALFRRFPSHGHKLHYWLLHCN